MNTLNISDIGIEKFRSNIKSKKDINDKIIARTSDICYILEPILIFLPKVIIQIINEYYIKIYILEYQTNCTAYDHCSEIFHIYFLSLCYSDKKYILSLYLRYRLINDGGYAYKVFNNHSHVHKYSIKGKYDITLKKKYENDISGSLCNSNINFNSNYFTNIENTTNKLNLFLNNLFNSNSEYFSVIENLVIILNILLNSFEELIYTNDEELTF
jgi:hypothetical protein